MEGEWVGLGVAVVAGCVGTCLARPKVSEEVQNVRAGVGTALCT